MKRLHIILIIVAVLLVPMNIQAQGNDTSRDIYTQAENDYKIGRFDSALDLLEKNINDFQGNLRQNAYRLISLCFLAQDNWERSEYYASQLLQENPYYSSVNDPVRFEEMISRLKMGRGTTLTTASSQAESIHETPVPVTIITAEMIDALGYNKNLNQILAAYVPGITKWHPIILITSLCTVPILSVRKKFSSWKTATV